MARPLTSLAPGQRSMRAGGSPRRPDQHITIVHVGRWRDHVARAAYRIPSGHDVAGPAARLKEAIAEGEIVPVTHDGDGLRVAC